MQQRPLALLALLAVAHRKGCSRDKLVGYLWPDSDQERARHRLADIVYLIRKSLGDHAVLASGETLRLNPDVVKSDVGAFLDALDASDVESAVEQYEGPLLDGFYASGLPDFERWVESERQRLGDEYSNALQSLAAASEASCDYVAAANWWKRLLGHDPYSSRFAIGLIKAFAASGDLANALRVLRDHESLLREELSVEPPAELHALGEQLVEGRGTRAPPQQEAVERSPTLSPHVATRPPLRWRLLATPFVVGLVAFGAVATGWLLLTGRAGDSEQRASVAVLPFENRSPDSDDAYFADAIHDEIIGQLAKIADLKVISPTSVREYKDRAKNLRTIADELQVTHILGGSVRRAGDRLRITVQLISAEDGDHLWVETYERTLSDVFAIQSDVAQQVAAALKARLSPEETGRIEREPTNNLEAYDFYLRGNSYLNRGFDEAFVRIAIQMYQNAVELDPQFAIAWARFCKAQTWMYFLYYDPTTERLTRAREAVDRALQVDPDLPEAHLALAWYFYQGHLDYERSLREVEIVRRTQPNNSEVWALIHYIQRRQGKFEEAAANIERALELDPRNGFVHDQASQTYRLMRKYLAAEQHLERATLLEPSSATGYLDGVRLYLTWSGSTERAREFLGQARAAGAADNEFLKYYSVVLDIFDRRYEAALDQLTSEALPAYNIYPSFVPRAQLIAQVHGLLENAELERAFYDSARATVEARLREVPDDDRLYSALGIAYARLGRKDDAVRAGKRAVELMPVEMEAWRGAVRLEDLARIQAMVGDDEAAVDQVEYLLSIPSALSVALLRVDPTWHSLRDHPRFQALLQKYKQNGT